MSNPFDDCVDYAPATRRNDPLPLDPELLADRLAYDHEERLKRSNALLAGIARFMTLTKDGIPDDDTLKKAADFVKQINTEIKTTNTLRETIKKPFLDCERAVDGFFKRKILDLLAAGKKSVEAKMTLFAIARAAESRRVAEEIAQRAREEAERLKAQALFDKAAEPEALQAAVEAEEAQKLTAMTTADHSRVHGDLGAVASLRTTWEWEVTDVSKLPVEYITANTQALNAAVKAGVREIPGARIFETQKMVTK